MADRIYSDYAYQSDGGEVLGVLPEHHQCKVGNGETYGDKVPLGTLYRCPCGRHWLKVRRDGDKWESVKGLRLRRLLRQVVPTASADSTEGGESRG